MKYLFLMLAFSAINTVQADVAHGVLEKCRNRVFIGTGMGNYVTIARAVNAGFDEIFSLEEDEVLVEHKKYLVPKDKNFYNYHAFQGDPASDLFNLIVSVEEPMTLFLGNYLPNIDEALPKNIVLDELEQIKNHPIKTHTILIDYIQYADTPIFGNITLKSIKDKILEINPLYHFRFEKGGHLEKEKDAVLVAYLEDIVQ